MEYDTDKVDELVLALLYLTTHEQGTRAWKGMDWEAMNRLMKRAISATQRTRQSQ